MQDTTIRVSTETRDALRQAADDLGASSLDDVLELLLREHRALRDIARLESDPAELAAYQAEAAQMNDDLDTDGLADGSHPW
jgi:hypothetical protein